MMDFLQGQVTPMGNYIAIWKLILFLLLFLFWAWVAQWLNKDARLVNTNRTLWNGINMGAGLGTLTLWLIIPAPFFIGASVFLLAWLILVVTYVMHRNSLVNEEERILTPDHFRYLLSRGGEPKEKVLRLKFTSSNKNELPTPQRQAPEYAGYVAAEELLYDMTFQRVSLCQLVPHGEITLMHHVIDGVKSNAGEQVRAEIDEAVGYLKQAAGLDVNEKRRPQKGNFWTESLGNKIEWSMQTAGSTRGEQVRISRVVQFETKSLDRLGFHQDQYDRLIQIIKGDPGVTLITGPTGSGVTTTLYGVISKHDGYTENLHSLENEALCDLDNVTQHTEEDAREGAGGGRRLQTVILGDPDVVAVGFCDDPEIARVSTEAVLNGKKLYVAMDSPSAFNALQSWIEMVGDNGRVAQTLKMVVNQRLVRKLCTTCRQAYAPDAGLLKKLNLPADKIKHFYRPPTDVEYDKSGNAILCEHCQGTGYYGRTAVYETLEISDSIRALIAENKPFNMIRAQSRKEKMLFLQEQAIRKVIEGETSIQEVLRVTTDKSSEAAKQSAAS